MTHGLEAQVKILIVCSDPTVLKILTIGFQDNGLMFDYVSTGEEALRLLGTSLADYVIIDNNLHDITSLELARQIKKLGSCQILLLANFSELGETLEALDKFIDDYLLKPFSFEQVMVILKRFRKIDQLRQEISIINQRIAELEEENKQLRTKIQEIYPNRTVIEAPITSKQGRKVQALSSYSQHIDKKEPNKEKF